MESRIYNMVLLNVALLATTSFSQQEVFFLNKKNESIIMSTFSDTKISPEANKLFIYNTQDGKSLSDLGNKISYQGYFYDYDIVMCMKYKNNYKYKNAFFSIYFNKSEEKLTEVYTFYKNYHLYFFIFKDYLSTDRRSCHYSIYFSFSDKIIDVMYNLGFAVKFEVSVPMHLNSVFKDKYLRVISNHIKIN